MRKLLPLLAAAMVVAAPAHAGPRDPEAELQRATAGRVAGEPVSCIPLNHIHSTRIIEDTAIVYDGGSVVYVNRPRSGAQSLDRWDTMVTRPFGSQLCRTDTVQLFDAGSRQMTGIVFLGDFVPYRRAPRD